MAKSKYQIELEDFKKRVAEVALSYIDEGYDTSCIQGFLDEVNIENPNIKNVTLEVELIGFNEDKYNYDVQSISSIEKIFDNILSEANYWNALENYKVKVIK